MARVVTRNLLVVLPSELEVGLRFLDRLSPDHLRLITHLEIRLQERGRLLYDRCPAPAEIKRVKRAVLTDEKVSLWQEVAPRLLARLPPGKTTIRLFCDLEDKPDRNDTHYAAAIVQPFLDAPAGILAACGIALFALADHGVALVLPGEFEGLETRTDALYFALTTLATVGYGDIHAQGQWARGLVIVQMVFNAAVIAGAARLLTSRLRARARPGSG
jgi:hypothetical protein